MRTLGNLLWHVPFCGFMAAIAAAIAGIVLVCTVVAAPIGLGLLQYAKFLISPFDHRMVDKSVVQTDVQKELANPLWETYSMIVKICWYPFGFCLACMQIVQIIGLCCTVVGIPVAMVVWKALGVVLNPVNKVCVHNFQHDQIMRAKKEANYDVKS